MPKPTKRDAAQALIDQIRELRLSGEDDEVEALHAEAEALIRGCRPQDRPALSAALEDAFTTVAERPPVGAEVSIRSYHDVEGVDDLQRAGVRQIRAAVKAGMSAATMSTKIAETLLEARLKMVNKAGLPDVIAERKFTKNIAHDAFVQARAGVTEEDVDRWATHQSLAKSVRNRMSDVVVDRLKSLDENPENFPAYAMDKARAAYPDLSPTEAVYALYESAGTRLPRKGRTELAREDARRRAELVRQAVAGQLTAGESADDDLARELADIERVEQGILETTKRVNHLTPEQRSELKARINQTIANLAAAAASL
ncbi:hypothetical protein [Streptomyces galilaeus]|uniref:hypothetical protein n=1 Tax=Streptomyces galilaeus TaxID=33899 RepID=UPI0038F77ADF